MKLQFYIPLLGAGANALQCDAVLRKILGSQLARLLLAHNDEMLERVLRVAASGPGITIVPDVSFSKQEMAMATRCEPLTKRLLQTADEDFDPLLNLSQGGRLHKAGGRLGKGVRVVDSLALTSLKLGKTQIACVGEGFPEYVLGDDIRRSLERAGLSGWSATDITSRKTGKPLLGGALLRAAAFSGPAEDDPTLWTSKDSNNNAQFKFAGCMVFPSASVTHLPDFARTSEPLEINDFPAWIVSQKVRQVFEEAGIKEWKWRPVIEAGSELHRKYLSLWEPVLKLIRLNPRNRF